MAGRIESTALPGKQSTMTSIGVQALLAELVPASI
jgi:hypothetical protein